MFGLNYFTLRLAKRNILENSRRRLDTNHGRSDWVQRGGVGDRESVWKGGTGTKKLDRNVRFSRHAEKLAVKPMLKDFGDLGREEDTQKRGKKIYTKSVNNTETLFF